MKRTISYRKMTSSVFYLDFAKCDCADYQISMNLHSNFCLIFAVKNNHGLHDKQRLLDIHRKDNF